MTTALISALTLERINKFLNSADGRDKFFRTVQYLTRFLSWHFQQKGNKAAAENATKISAAMSDGRTLLRLLKWLNEWQKYRDTVKGFMAAKKEGSRPEDRDIVTFVLTTLRAVGNEGYFFFDNMMWLCAFFFLMPRDFVRSVFAVIAS